jgi:hypothetical protein
MRIKIGKTNYGNLSVAAFFFEVNPGLFSLYKIVGTPNTNEWRETRGVVIKSEVNKFFDSPSKPNVVYEYEVGGERFTSNEIAFLYIGGGGFADTTAANYPLGKVVAVYYEPDNQARAILEPKLSVVVYYMLMAGILCLGVWRWAAVKAKKAGS